MNSKLKQFLHDEWLQLLLLALPIIASLAALPFATDRVPMQWGIDGRVNWTAPKEWGLLVMPATLVLIYGLIFWFESRDPSRHRETDGTLTSHGKATRSIRMIISVVLGAVTIIQIAAALGRHPDVSRVVPSLVALMLAFLGNFFGKLKPNRYAGIRVPWTLNSENVWRITHRISGWIYTASSLVFLAAIWLLPQRCQTWLFAGWIAALVVAPLFIAWRAAVAERQGKTLSS
jgi:uncharacterized membrane protein